MIEAERNIPQITARGIKEYTRYMARPAITNIFLRSQIRNWWD